MHELIFGGLIGLGASGVHQIFHQYLYYEVMKLRLVPWRPSRKQAFFNRVRRVLRPRLSRSVGALLLAPVIPLFAIGWSYWGLTSALGILLGYSLIPGITLFGMRKLNRRFQEKIQKLALDRLMRNSLDAKSQSDQILNILKKATEQTPPAVKVYAIEQMARLGHPEGRSVLNKMKHSPDHTINKTARKALENLDKLLSGKFLLSARQLPVFIDEAEYWNRQYYARRGPSRRESVEKQAELTGIINDIVDSQVLIRKGFPDLLCTMCFTRAEEHVHGRWTYVLCRHCGDVLNLKTGISKVVGCIGNFPPEREKDGVLYLNMWRGKNRKALYADLDELIIKGGGDVNYDWAVSAVVAQLREHLPEDGLESDRHRIEVVLEDNPPLDANSMNLLREIGWED